MFIFLGLLYFIVWIWSSHIRVLKVNVFFARVK